MSFIIECHDIESRERSVKILFEKGFSGLRINPITGGIVITPITKLELSIFVHTETHRITFHTLETAMLNAMEGYPMVSAELFETIINL